MSRNTLGSSSTSHPIGWILGIASLLLAVQQGFAVTYSWRTTTYEWVDISGSGTYVSGLGDDNNFGPYSIGFNFPFYGSSFSTFRVCENGWISFTSSAHTYTDTALPSTSAPENLVAPFFDDLDFRSQGSVCYKRESNRLIVSWLNAQHFSMVGGPYSFQLILYNDGRIILQYQQVASLTYSASVGIQNGTRTAGVQVFRGTASSSSSPANGRAFEIYPSGSSSSVAAPYTINASDGTYVDKIAVSWAASRGATWYDVYRCSSLSDTPVYIATVTAPKFDDWYPTQRGRLCYYAVRAKNAANSSPLSRLDPGHMLPMNVSSAFSATDLSGATGAEIIFRVTVPMGQTLLDVRTSGGTGDCDIYAKPMSIPTVLNANIKSEGPSTLEGASAYLPMMGTWYVTVRGKSAFSGVTLTIQAFKAVEQWDYRVCPESGVALTTADWTELKNEFRQAANYVLDATDGQVRLGRIQMTRYSAINYTLANIKLTDDDAAYAKQLPWIFGYIVLGMADEHYHSHGTIVHESGHFKMGLGDEYTVYRWCWDPSHGHTILGLGWASANDPNHADLARECPDCIMDWNYPSEFCTPLNHVTNPANDQEEKHGVSCWNTIHSHNAAIRAPASSPLPGPAAQADGVTPLDETQAAGKALSIIGP